MVDSKKLISLVEKYEKLIYDTADHIWAHPETGYREWKTSAYMEQHFEELGYTLTKAGFEAQAQLANAVRDIEHMKPEDILKSTIPLHKGAIRYYRERGIQIPDRLIPPEAK